MTQLANYKSLARSEPRYQADGGLAEWVVCSHVVVAQVTAPKSPCNVASGGVTARRRCRRRALRPFTIFLENHVSERQTVPDTLDEAVDMN